MRVREAVLKILSLLVPPPSRSRWLEEWQAEIRHGGWRMLPGAVPDAIALRRFGTRGRTARPFDALSQDFRHGLRGLVGSPVFTAGVVASLAIGIASTAAAFGFLHTLLFRGIPGVSEQDRLARLTIQRGCGWPGCWIRTSTPEDYDALRAPLPSLTQLSAEVPTHVAARIGGDAHALRAALVSANYFDVLGVQPALGRAFRSEEEQLAHADVAVISHVLWQRLFSGDPGVLGRFVDVAGHAVRIVGVAPRDFGSSLRGNTAVGGDKGTEIWLPLPLVTALAQPAEGPPGTVLPRTEYRLNYIGRLKPGATIEQAQADAALAAARIKAVRGAAGADSFVQVQGISRIEPGEATRLLRNLMVVPLVVLAIACMNAANLLLARGSERARDIAVRLALGASRWRIIRQVLVESLILSVLSGAVAIPAIHWLLALGERFTGLFLSLSGPALFFTIVASLICAFGFGLAPAARASLSREALGSSRPGNNGPGPMRARRVMVTVQIALSLGLLASGGQVLGAVRGLFERTGAVDPERLVLATFDLDQLAFARPAAEQFYSQLLDRVSQIPGVENVALARRSALWTWGRGKGESPIVVWAPGELPRQGALYLGGYAAGDLTGTVGLRLVAGRGFRSEDATPRPTAAIVSRAFADAKLDGSAVGRTIRVAARNQGYARAVDVTVVGVVEAAEDLAYSKQPLQTVYVSSPLEYEPALTLYVRTRADLVHVASALRAAVREIDPRVPIAELETLANLTARRHFEEQVMAGGLTLLGSVALALATAGLYALMSFMVALRRRELGVRIALGAAPSEIQRLVLRQSLRLALVGSLFGGVAAIVSGAVVHASIFGAPRVDATMFAAAAGALAAAMVIASAVPARRAARVNPIEVLRAE